MATVLCPTRDKLIAGVAQSVEQLICNQPVAGSNPVTSLPETLIYQALHVIVSIDRVDKNWYLVPLIGTQLVPVPIGLSGTINKLD